MEIGMDARTDLVTVRRGTADRQHARVYRVDDVERRLDKLPAKEHESLRSTYERMLEKGPERFQVKPRACRRWSTCTTSCPTSTTCSTT